MTLRLNIIVVEDNDDLRDATVEALQTMGHEVKGLDCAEAVDEEIGNFSIDIMVLDLNLPGEDGLSLALRLRKVNPDLGIIMLTARNKAHDIAAGYNSGADIYLPKPTTFDGLDSAIQSLSRRIHPPVAPADQLTLKQASRQLQGPTALVDLSQYEYMLLTAFAIAKNHRLENWQLMEITGKDAEAASKSALEGQIVRLRRKLEQAGAKLPSIKAIRGIGYQLCVPLVIQKNSR